MLNDDTLLNLFSLYPEDIVEAYEDLTSWPEWDKERWWYKLVHVCRRWRYLILSSPVRLDLHLVCTYGTPVADMLAHSPPFPLIIYYLDANRDASVEDEEAILLSLQDRGHVRRIGLMMPATKLLQPIIALDGHFPVLERLFIWPLSHDNMSLMLPTRFRAPHLCMLSLYHVVVPVRSPLLTTTVGLVELGLWDMPLLASFRPSDLVARLSSMPQLESLSIGFRCPIPTRDMERQLLRIPIGTPVTLPNLRLCFFRCGSAYLEGLLAQIDTPLLRVLNILFYNQLTFTVPHLLQFIGRTENLRFRAARLSFYPENVILTADGDEENKINSFDVRIGCRHVDWQVSAAAQIFGALVPALSVVEHLFLSFDDHDVSSEERNEVDRTLWRDVLRPFSSVKVLRMDDRLIRNLSSSLQPEDGEPPLELLPQLKELVYFNRSAGDAFTSFIQSRQMAGRPVALTHVLHRPL
jgi:hypothetical protein